MATSMATSPKEFKLGDYVVVQRGTLQEERGFIRGTAVVCGEYGNKGPTLTLTYMVALDKGKYLVDDAGIQRGFVSMISVHPDNMEVDDDGPHSIFDKR